MARDTLGKKVKQFSHQVPQPDLSSVSEVVHVYFKADTAKFHIYPPEHITQVVKGHAKRPDAMHSLTGEIFSATYAEVEEAFKSACSRYLDILRTEQRKRVIRFQFKANHPRISRYLKDAPADIHFAPYPAVALNYEVLWQAGDRLYRQHRPDDPLQDAGSAVDLHRSEGHFLIDWTEEREEFFQRMRDGLTRLIDQIHTFTQDLGNNVDLAISHMNQGLALLPPPPEGDEA